MSAGFYHGLLPSRFAAQEYCWWNSRLPESFVALWSNYLCNLTSHLASRDSFEMLGVHHQHFHVPLQHVKNRLPKAAHTFQSDVSYAHLLEVLRLSPD